MWSAAPGDRRARVPLAAAVRHRIRYLACRWRVNDDAPDRDVIARHVVAISPLGPRKIMLVARRPVSEWDPRHDEVGQLNYRVCDLCRIGMVFKIHTSEQWKRQGYATWMLERSRRIFPDYRWITSRQMSAAQTFWEFVMARIPGQYRWGKPCRHLLTSLRHPARDHWRSA